MHQMTKLKCLNAAHLKIIAMVCMFLDHLWGTLVTGNLWMTCIGRIAFPIFAFQIAEGYAHTKNFRRYLLRMFLFALVSEIPFNLMNAGGLFYPLHQNVMFSFCIALLMIRLIDRFKDRHWALRVLMVLVALVLGYLLGFITFADYYGYGVLMVLVFWLFREIRFGWLIQLAAMIYINFELMGGLGFDFVLYGVSSFVPVQGFAVLALIPIWLYNGRQGTGSKVFQYAVYAFYPAHLLILSLIAMFG